MTNEVIRDGSVGVGASVFSVLMGVLKPLGEVASSMSSIIGCIVACIMLWRLLRPSPVVVPPYHPPAVPNQEPASGTKSEPAAQPLSTQ